MAEWANLSELTYPLFMLGRWDEALALIPEPSEEHTRSGAVVLSLLGSLVEIHLHRGQPEEARRIFTLFSHLEGSSDVQDQSCYLATRASIARAEGRLPWPRSTAACPSLARSPSTRSPTRSAAASAAR